MIADESLVTLNGLKKYDQKKGTAVIEVSELPAEPLNKVYNVGEAGEEDVFSKDVKLSTYQQMLDEVDKVTVDGNTQDANRNIISKAVIEQANVPPAPLNKVYNIGGSPIELTASGTCTHETSPGGTESVTVISTTDITSDVTTPGNHTVTYEEDTGWDTQEITIGGTTYTAYKKFEPKVNEATLIAANSVIINGTTFSNLTNGQVLTGADWIAVWHDLDHLGNIYATSADTPVPTVTTIVDNSWKAVTGNAGPIPAGTTEITFDGQYTYQIDMSDLDHAHIQFPAGNNSYGYTDMKSNNIFDFAIAADGITTPTITIETAGSGLYMGDCYINHLPAGSSFKLKSSIDNVWHTVSYPLPENGVFIYGSSLSEECCMVIQVDNKLRVITVDDTQNQAFTINYEEETSTRVFSKSTELVTKDAADDTYIPQSEKGVASGVATLGADGKVPRSQLTIEAMEYKGKVYPNTTEPTDKSVGDVYFVGETGTIWSKSVNEGDQLVWNGSAWDVWSAGKVLSVDGKTNEVVINQSLTSTQYNNLQTIDPLVNYFITDKKQIYRNGYCYSIKVVALSQADYNNLSNFEKQDTMALYIVDSHKLYYLDNPVGMLGNELRWTTSIPTEEGFFVYVGNVPNAANLARGCIYYARQSSSSWVYDLYTPKNTSDIIEASALTNIQTTAGATQHAVNEAIDHAIYVDELAIGNNTTDITNLRNQLGALKTADITENSALANIGTSANATQHAINEAIDSECGKKPNVWIGHKADWDLLSVSEKTKYDEAHFDDDTAAGQVTDAVTDGDMRTVTSNAVYDACPVKNSAPGINGFYYKNVFPTVNQGILDLSALYSAMPLGSRYTAYVSEESTFNGTILPGGRDGILTIVKITGVYGDYIEFHNNSGEIFYNHNDEFVWSGWKKVTLTTI